MQVTALEQVAQTGCGVSLLGDLHMLPEHGPEQPAPCLSGGVGPDDFQSSLPTLATLVTL